MTEQEFNNLMGSIATVRRHTQELFTLRVWARLGEAEVTYQFRNVVTAEVYDLVRSIWAVAGSQIAAGNMRIFFDPLPIRV